MTTTKRDSALPKSDLDKATRERINHILGLDPATLSLADQTFINARKDYLTVEERKDFVNKVEEEEDGDEYDAMDVRALKVELKKRELPVGGKVGELRDRLRDNDEVVGASE